MISEATRVRFDREVAKYPNERKQSAGVGRFGLLQQEQGWISPEAELAVAEYLGMPAVVVSEVVTFYNMYNREPQGQFKLNVCTNLPCQLRNGQSAAEYLSAKLGTEIGGTTRDGLFTLQQ